MDMPTFDVVSEVDAQEVNNAIDQSNREVNTRFDFKGVDAKFELDETGIEMTAEAEFQLQQMMDILKIKLVKRKIDIGCLVVEEPVASGKLVRQHITVRQGLDAELARRIVKMIKQEKIKVQAAIQGEKVRVSGKKRDSLQQIITLLRESKIDLPLQYSNFRD